MSTFVRAIIVLTGAVILLAVLIVFMYLHKDLATPMHCRCGRRPTLEL